MTIWAHAHCMLDILCYKHMLRIRNTILYYIRNQLDATLAVLFINNCKITLHVSDVYRVHHQEY